MRKNIIHRSLLVIITIILFSCEDWLDKHPYDVVSSDEVWTDITTAEGVLANLYDRLNTSPFDKANMQLTDEAKDELTQKHGSDKSSESIERLR